MAKDKTFERCALVAWNSALEKMLHLIRVRQAQWPKHSSMYASLEDIAKDAIALKRSTNSSD